MDSGGQFYIKYYIGHTGEFGKEYLEFEFRNDGKLTYENNTRYKGESCIRRQVYVSDTMLNQVKEIISSSGILKENDSLWPQPDKIGSQSLEIAMGIKVYKFKTSKIGSFSEVQKSKDPEGLTTFFYLVQDLKCLVFSLVNLHFRIKPVG